MLLVLLGACAPAGLPDPAPPREPEPAHGEPLERAPRHCPVPRQPELTEAPPSIAPDERVPDFLLATAGCQVFDSRELVGKVPFVVVFFASWCSVCEHRVPLLRNAFRERAGQVTPLWVSLDEEAEAWAQTRAFLLRHELAPESAVAGRDFLGFSLGYNPFRSVPVVVVVGRSGRVIIVQVGVRDGDDAALQQALDEAIDQPGALFTSFPRP